MGLESFEKTSTIELFYPLYMLPKRSKNISDLEESAIEKYQDLLDTILVAEAMKRDTKKGTSWQKVKHKLSSHV